MDTSHHDDDLPAESRRRRRFVPRRLIAVPRRPSGSFRITGLSLVVGLVTGLAVVIIKHAVADVQIATLSYAADEGPLFASAASFPRTVFALCLGAMIVAALTHWLESPGRRPSPGSPIDAVEANALRGGLMHARDGVSVVAPILGSVGFGASVGIEAAVTQLGAVFASLLGQYRSLPRSDLRLLVGAGAAAAISTAYDAPLAGMLYAFELVLGSYATRMLGPVGLAAIAGSLLARAVGGGAEPFRLAAIEGVNWPDYPLAILIGCAAAGTGILTMLLVSSVERLLKRLFRRMVLRLLAGALALSAFAAVFPLVLGSGHVGILETLNGRIVGIAALVLLVAKLLASAISLGSGFRGGLFSASLFIGALLGQVIAAVAAAAAPLLPGHAVAQPGLCTAIGMAAVGASIVGSPLAMIFLVNGLSGEPDVGVIVAVGAVTASFLTNRLFGYSFATWRFQQRGLALDGGADVSQLSAITIEGLVRPPKRSVTSDADLLAVMQAVSAAGGKGTAVYALDGTFLGLIEPALVEVAEGNEPLPIVAADLIDGTSPVVTVGTTLAAMLSLLRNDDRATFAVVDEEDNRELVGCVRARDVYAAVSGQVNAGRESDLGAAA